MDLDRILSFKSTSELASAARDELNMDFRRTKYFCDVVFAIGAGFAISQVIADYDSILDESLSLAALGAGLRAVTSVAGRYFDRKLAQYV